MSTIYNILILKILNEIIPATKISVTEGNKIFGAAILSKNDYSTLVVGTNNEIVNPLYHGEISTINKFFSSNLSKKIKPSECIFLSTHEPCSLCLSAITWSGFNIFYYFFPYSETKDSFKIPHDLNILKEIFNIQNGSYNKDNNYWKSYSIIEEVNKLNNQEKHKLQENIKKIYQEYKKLSNFYQKSKKLNKIPLN